MFFFGIFKYFFFGVKNNKEYFGTFENLIFFNIESSNFLNYSTKHVLKMPLYNNSLILCPRDGKGGPG
jgi:hypothetical protein